MSVWGRPLRAHSAECQEYRALYRERNGVGGRAPLTNKVCICHRIKPTT